MTGLQEKRSTQASASASVAESSNGTRETVKKRKVTVTKTNGVKEKEKRVFTLPGQKHDPPAERDPLRVFYESLREQIPSSDMAELWMMEHGLLSADDAKKALEKKQGRSKFGTPVKASIKVKAEVKAEVQGNGSKGKVVVKAEVKTEVKAEAASTNGVKSRVAVPKARRKLDDSDSDEDFIASRKAKVRKRE